MPDQRSVVYVTSCNIKQMGDRMSYFLVIKLVATSNELHESFLTVHVFLIGLGLPCLTLRLADQGWLGRCAGFREEYSSWISEQMARSHNSTTSLPQLTLPFPTMCTHCQGRSQYKCPQIQVSQVHRNSLGELHHTAQRGL